MTADRTRVRRRQLATVRPQRVEWLVPGLIPFKTATLFPGIGGLGKSTLLAGYAAATSRGEYGNPASVLIVSYEDTAAEILRPRIEAAEGDLELVHELYVEPEDGGLLVLPRDLGAIEHEIEQTGARLVIIDPIVAALDLHIDAHKDQHVRVVLAQLVAIARATGCAFCLVAHLNKAPTKEPYLRVNGSPAFWNACRSCVLVTADPTEPEHHRLVTQRKANWARYVAVQRHRIDEIQLSTLDPNGEPIVTSRMVYVEDADDVDRDDVLDNGRARDGEGKLAQALVFLFDCLGDGEWHDSVGLKHHSRVQGISDRTLQRAASDLRVEHEDRDFPRTTHWRLPRQSRQGSPHIVGATAEPPGNRMDSGIPSGREPVAPNSRVETSVGATGSGNHPASDLEALVEAELRANPEASANEVCKAVDGRRSDVLRIYKNVRERVQPRIDEERVEPAQRCVQFVNGNSCGAEVAPGSFYCETHGGRAR